MSVSEQVAALEKTITDMTGATTHALKKMVEKYELPEDALKCFQYHFTESMEGNVEVPEIEVPEEEKES